MTAYRVTTFGRAPESPSIKSRGIECHQWIELERNEKPPANSEPEVFVLA
jgi:hypothetical protein